MRELHLHTKTNRLYINDYNLDSNNAKTQGMINLIKRINTSSKLIDGVGTQMHLSVSIIGLHIISLTCILNNNNTSRPEVLEVCLLLLLLWRRLASRSP